MGMKHKNVCKFSALPSTHALEIRCFVQETDQAVIAQPGHLQWNRAYLFIRGDGELRVRYGAVLFRPGTLVFGFEGEEIRIVSAQPCEYMYIDFSGMRAQELMLRFGIGEKARSFGGLEGLIPLWNESLLRASKDTVDLAAESMLLFAFSRLADGRVQQGGLISRILLLIDERFTETGFSVDSFFSYKGHVFSYVAVR